MRDGFWPGPGFCLRVLFHAQLPGGAQCSGQLLRVGFGEDDVGGSVAAPAAGDGEEDLRLFGHEHGLLGGSEHEVSVT